MDAVAYLRVSSRAQKTAMQRAAIERMAGHPRGDTVTDWRQEKRSARTIVRSDLDRLRADVRSGLIRKLYVFKLDRLTRPGIRETFEVVEELRVHHCELVSVADGFDLNGPAAAVILAVMAWAAKMERLAINERAHRGRPGTGGG